MEGTTRWHLLLNISDLSTIVNKLKRICSLVGPFVKHSENHFKMGGNKDVHCMLLCISNQSSEFKQCPNLNFQEGIPFSGKHLIHVYDPKDMETVLRAEGR